MPITPPKRIGDLVPAAPVIWRRTFLKGVYEMQNGEQKEVGFFHALVPPPSIIFAITSDGKVAVTRQYRLAAELTMYELPGGNARSPDETPEGVAARELEEETGYRGTVSRLAPQPVWFLPDALTVPFWPCLAQNCAKVGEPKPHALEWLERVLMPLPEWMERIGNGEVPDAKSLATTLLALLKLGIIETKFPT